MEGRGFVYPWALLRVPLEVVIIYSKKQLKHYLMLEQNQESKSRYFNEKLTSLINTSITR